MPSPANPEQPIEIDTAMKMPSKTAPPDQFCLGVLVFNAMFGLPACFLLAQTHPLSASLLFPFVSGFGILLSLYRSAKVGRHIPVEIHLVMVLIFLQLCCAGWVLPSLVNGFGAGKMSNVSNVPFVMFILLEVARRVAWQRYKHSGRKNRDAMPNH